MPSKCRGGYVCCAVGCNNSTRSGEISLFRVPKDAVLGRLWLERAGRTDLLDHEPEKWYNCYRLCRKHFDDSQFFVSGRLVWKAMPTIFEGAEGLALLEGFDMASVTSSCSQTPMSEAVGEGCRICHEACHLAKDIYTHQDPGKLIYEIIDDICRLGIFPGDGQSRYICTNCHQSVLQFYRFKRSAQEGQAALECIRKSGEPNRLGANVQKPGDASPVDDYTTRRERRRSTNSLCRLCVNVSRFYRNIFMQKHHGIYFYQIINELCCLNVATGDDFPAWVCQVCHTNVIEFFKFKRLAHYKNSSSLPRRSAIMSPGSQTGLRLKSEDSLLDRSARGLGESQIPVNDSRAEVDGSFSGYGNVGSGNNGAIDSSPDDEDDVDDYLEWVEYREFTDFMDNFPLRGSDDEGCFEAGVLHEMKEALSVGRTGTGVAAQRAADRREYCEQRLEALKSSQSSRNRLHELRMMRMKAEIGLKEQKVRHMREMVAVKKKIMESKAEIEKMKAKTQELNDWRESIEKNGSTSGTHDGDPPQVTDERTEAVDGLPGNVAIKEEPKEDYFEVEEIAIKEEPHSGSDRDEESIAVGNEQESVTADTSLNECEEKDSRKRHQGGGDNGLEGDIARRRKVRRRSSYSTENLRLAVETVASKQWSIWKAANHFKIPWSLLRDYVKISQESGYISSLPSSDKTAEFGLSPENEDKLVKFVTEMKQRGFRMCPERVKRMAVALAVDEKEGEPLEYDETQNCASDSWLEDFCSRHSLKLSTMTDSTLLPSYHPDCTLLSTFYDKIRLLYDQLGVVISPNQVWNCDETSLRCVLSDDSIVSRAGRRYPYGTGVEHNRDLRVNTVLTCGSAAGDVGPTMVVFKEEGEDSSLSCPDVMIASSKTGFLDHSKFEEWFNKFTQEVEVERPLILLLDSQNNHLSPQVIDAAVEGGVILIPVDFFDCGSLQPIEVSLMRPLHGLWCRYLEEFQQGDSSLVPRNCDFMSWFPSAFHAVAVEDGIIAGFCKSGIYPPHRLALKNTTASRAEQGEQKVETSMKFDETGFELRLRDFIKGLHAAL